MCSEGIMSEQWTYGDGKGKLAGTVQRAIIFDNYTAIINVENGQIIDFYIGTELKGLIRLRRLR